MYTRRFGLYRGRRFFDEFLDSIKPNMEAKKRAKAFKKRYLDKKSRAGIRKKLESIRADTSEDWDRWAGPIC